MRRRVPGGNRSGMASPLPPPRRGRAALAGLVAGGVTGFVLIEGGAGLLRLLFGWEPDVENSPPLIVLFAAGPPLCAAIGAVVGARLAGRRGAGGD
jgi:hypothetical protein